MKGRFKKVEFSLLVMKKAKNDHAAWKRRALIAGLGISTALFGGSSSQIIPNFEKAKLYDRYAQPYIDSQVRKFGKPSALTKIIYKEKPDESPKTTGKYNTPEFLLSDARHCMRTYFDLPSNSTAKNIKTEVYRDAFILCESECDFNSSLVDHEYVHVNQLGEELTLIASQVNNSDCINS
jgi:hypothetical protein